MLKAKYKVIVISCFLVLIILGLLYKSNHVEETDILEQILDMEVDSTKDPPLFFGLKGDATSMVDITGLNGIAWRCYLSEDTNYLKKTMQIKRYYTKKYGEPLIGTIDKSHDEVERYEWKLQDNTTIYLVLYQHAKGYTPVGNIEILLYKDYNKGN